jgi:hypothetical protein
MDRTSKPFALLFIILFIMSLVGLPQITRCEPTWNTQIVDTHGSYGKLAIDSNDTPHLLYNKYSQGEDVTYGLSYAVWTGKNWNTETIDSTGIFGVLSLDATNKPHAVYKSLFPNNKLEYATLNGNKWIIEDLHSLYVDSLAGYAIVMDPNGNPHVIYSIYSYTNNTYTTNLVYTVADASNWTNQTIETKNSNINYGFIPKSILLDSNGYTHILYGEKISYEYFSKSLNHKNYITEQNVVYAHWTGLSWTIQTVATNASAIGNLVLDSKGQPNLCYIHKNSTYLPNGSFTASYSLEYTHLDGSTWVNQTIESIPGNIDYQQPFLRLADNGNPQVFFYTLNYQNQSDSGLKYAKWIDSNWKIQTIGLKDYTDIAFDSQGNPHITYDMTVGSIRGAPILGNLTYASLKYPSFSNSISVAVMISGAIIITVAIAFLLLYRRHRKTNNLNK